MIQKLSAGQCAVSCVIALAACDSESVDPGRSISPSRTTTFETTAPATTTTPPLTSSTSRAATSSAAAASIPSPNSSQRSALLAKLKAADEDYVTSPDQSVMRARNVCDRNRGDDTRSVV